MAMSPASFAVCGEEHHRGAVAAQTVGIALQRTCIDAELGQEIRAAERDFAAINRADHAFSGRRVKVADIGRCEIALRGGRDDGGGQRMFAGPLDGGGKAQHLGFVKFRRRDDGRDLRLAFGQRSGLVDHQGVDFLHPLQRFGVLDQDAGARAAPDADHDRHRRRQARARKGRR